MQKGPKEPIPEEQELDFQGLEERGGRTFQRAGRGGPEAGKPVGWALPAASKLSLRRKAGADGACGGAWKQQASVQKAKCV